MDLKRHEDRPRYAALDTKRWEIFEAALREFDPCALAPSPT